MISSAALVAPTDPRIELPAGRDGTSFAGVLAQAEQDRAAVRESAAQLVSTTFILPVLESMHDSPFQQPPFAPGFAEKRFMPLLDQQLADRITSGANFPLVDVITERLMGRAQETPDAPSSPVMPTRRAATARSGGRR